jgi:hypothetical protein
MLQLALFLSQRNAQEKSQEHVAWWNVIARDPLEKYRYSRIEGLSSL